VEVKHQYFQMIEIDLIPSKLGEKRYLRYTSVCEHPSFDREQAASIAGKRSNDQSMVS
jgi:hypothetical protein